VGTKRARPSGGDTPAGPPRLVGGPLPHLLLHDGRHGTVVDASKSVFKLADPEHLETALHANDLETAYSRAREQLDRRTADRDLYDRLTAAAFAGPEYREFANELAAYGIAVVTAWLRYGQMFKLCAAHDRPVGPRPQTWTEDDIAGLADETVTAALIDFRRRALAGDGWEYSEDAASLKTYFAAGCVLAFPNVYRKWERAEQRWRSLHDFRETFEDVPAEAVGTPDVATTALRRQEAADGYASLSEKERLIAFYRLAGYSNAEIAELLDIAGPRAVEGVIYRLHQKTNKRREQEGGEHS
jgi:DNA-directed RNA polymerase specialized sigma24 family protein